MKHNKLLNVLRECYEKPQYEVIDQGWWIAVYDNTTGDLLPFIVQPARKLSKHQKLIVKAFKERGIGSPGWLKSSVEMKEL